MNTYFLHGMNVLSKPLSFKPLPFLGTAALSPPHRGTILEFPPKKSSPSAKKSFGKILDSKKHEKKSTLPGIGLGNSKICSLPNGGLFAGDLPGYKVKKIAFNKSN